MPKVGFESTISEGERPYTYALGGAETGTGTLERIQWHINPLKISQRISVFLIIFTKLPAC